MGFRFFKRIQLAPGISINLSRSGVSASLGPRGAKVTLGPRGIRKTVGLRASEEEETLGLDVTEHGLASAYAGFAFLPETLAPETIDAPVAVSGDTPVAEAVEVKAMPVFDKPRDGKKLSKVEIVCKEAKTVAL